jgi:hypothetical protein
LNALNVIGALALPISPPRCACARLAEQLPLKNPRWPTENEEKFFAGERFAVAARCAFSKRQLDTDPGYPAYSRKTNHRMESNG